MVAAEQLGADCGWVAGDAFRRLGMTRYPVFSLLDRVGELRDNLSACDADATTVQQIIQEAEVFESTFFSYFPPVSLRVIGPQPGLRVAAWICSVTGPASSTRFRPPLPGD